jgi:hypothetical protein
MRGRKPNSKMTVFGKEAIIKHSSKQTLMGAFHALSYSGEGESMEKTMSKSNLKQKYDFVADNDNQI